jgi:hypothetical protein
MVVAARTTAIRQFTIAGAGSASPKSAAASPNTNSPTYLLSDPGSDTEAIPIGRAGGPRLSSMRFFPQSPTSCRAQVRAVTGDRGKNVIQCTP